MSEEAFKAIITAQDQTAAAMEAIIKRLDRVTHAADQAAAHTRGLHTKTKTPLDELKEHLGEVGERFDGVKEHVSGVLETMAELVPALGALGAASSIAGLFEITERAAEGLSKLNAAALKIGIARKELGALGYAALRTDVPVESLQGGLVKLDRAITGAATGKNRAAAAVFKHLGIKLRDAHGHLVSVTAVLPRLEDAFKRTPDGPLRASVAVALFGKAGADLLPLLIQGSKEIDKLAARGRALKYAPDDEQLEALERYHTAMIDIGVATRTFTFELGSKLAPALAPVIEHMTAWVTANRDWITTAIADKVEHLSQVAEKFVEDTDWSKVETKLAALLDSVNAVADALNGWIGVGEAVLVFYAGRFLTEMLASVFKVSTALLALPGKAAEAAEAANLAMAKIDVAGKVKLLAKAGGYGFLADTALTVVDPNDRLGSYVDQHVPGAAFVDNLFSHVGLGRSYEEQQLALQPLPELAAPLMARTSAAPTVQQSGMVDVNITLAGAPPGTIVQSAAGGIANIGTQDVGVSLFGP